jgi:hypothetical protein
MAGASASPAAAHAAAAPAANAASSAIAALRDSGSANGNPCQSNGSAVLGSVDKKGTARAHPAARARSTGSAQRLGILNGQPVECYRSLPDEKSAIGTGPVDSGAPCERQGIGAVHVDDRQSCLELNCAGS